MPDLLRLRCVRVLGSLSTLLLFGRGSVAQSLPPATQRAVSASNDSEADSGPGDEETDYRVLDLAALAQAAKAENAMAPRVVLADPIAGQPFAQSRGDLQLRKFPHIKNTLGGDFEASGGGQVVLTDAKTQKQTVVSAQHIVYTRATGLIVADGSVRLDRDGGVFLGKDLQYNVGTREGVITDSIAEGDGFRLRGKRIRAAANGSYIVEEGVFTTCLRGRPDYQIKAHRLTVTPGQSVSGSGITFYAGTTPLFLLPGFKRSLKRAVTAPAPVPGYDKNEGPFIRYRTNLIERPSETVPLDLRFSVRRLPIGYVGYEADIGTPPPGNIPPLRFIPGLQDPLHGVLEEITPPTYREYTENRFEDEYAPRTTFAAAIQNEQFVYNRRYTNLVVTRTPEIGVTFTNILGYRNYNRQVEQARARERRNAPVLLGDTTAALKRFPNAPFLLDVEVRAGEIYERPTEITRQRLAFRINAATQPLLLGRRLSLRAGVTDWANLYSSGTAYNLFSPEVDLNYIPTRTSRFGIAYRFAEDAGRTPFFFDRRDIRHELRLEYQVSGPWAFGVGSRVDLERGRTFDSELAVIRNFDCLQVGVTYRVRAQQFNFVFNLLPPSADRASRRLLPLQTTRSADEALSDNLADKRK